MALTKSSARLSQVFHDYFFLLRRLLQRKRQFKIEIIPCWSRIVFMLRQRMNDLLLRACVVVRSLYLKIARRHLAKYVKEMYLKCVSQVQHALEQFSNDGRK